MHIILRGVLYSKFYGRHRPHMTDLNIMATVRFMKSMRYAEKRLTKNMKNWPIKILKTGCH